MNQELAAHIANEIAEIIPEVQIIFAEDAVLVQHGGAEFGIVGHEEEDGLRLYEVCDASRQIISPKSIDCWRMVDFVADKLNIEIKEDADMSNEISAQVAEVAEEIRAILPAATIDFHRDTDPDTGKDIEFVWLTVGDACVGITYHADSGDGADYTIVDRNATVVGEIYCDAPGFAAQRVCVALEREIERHRRRA